MGVVQDLAIKYIKENPGGIAWRVKSHAKVIEKHLNENEEVKFVFVGQKNDRFYDLFTSCVIALTNKRILVGQKRVVWGYFLKSITPDLFNDLYVYHGLIWGKVKIDTMKEVVTVSNVAKSGVDDIETSVSMHMMNAKRALRTPLNK